MIVLDGAETAFTARGEKARNGAVGARNLLVEVGERDRELVGEEGPTVLLPAPMNPMRTSSGAGESWSLRGIVAGVAQLALWAEEAMRECAGGTTEWPQTYRGHGRGGSVRQAESSRVPSTETDAPARASEDLPV